MSIDKNIVITTTIVLIALGTGYLAGSRYPTTLVTKNN